MNEISSKSRFVGRSLERSDGRAKVEGKAEYLRDMLIPDMAFAAVIRSPYPRAKLKKINKDDALKIAGVIDVITPEEVKDFSPVNIFPNSPKIQKILNDNPQFVGDAVGAVVAETFEIARRVADEIEIEFEELPSCLSIDSALNKEVVIHGSLHDNFAGPVISTKSGDFETALKECSHIFDGEYETQRQCAQTIEAMACVCDWSNESVLRVWTHLDSMFHFRDSLAEMLDIEADSVVVEPPEALGATFGLKNSLIASLEPLCAILSRRTGKPVKLQLTPEESIFTTVSRHPAKIRLITGLDENYNVLARKAEVLLDSGAYGWGYVVALSMLGKWSCLYPCDNQEFTATSVYTNHIPGGAYRAVGTAQIHFAMESQIDEICKEIDMDPLEFRLKNSAKVGDELPMGTKIRSWGLEECLAKGAEVFGWESKKTNKIELENPSGMLRGVGMAIGMHHAGLTGLIPTPEGSKCYAEIVESGKIEFRVGVVEKGQGSITTLEIIAAEIIDVETSQIKIVNSGTSSVPFDFSGAEASRTTYIVGRAVADAAQQIRNMTEGKNVRLVDLVGESVVGEFEPLDNDPLPVIGAHFCEVEIDEISGMVYVKRYVAAQDVGRVINLSGCMGQIEGGIHHGLGYALCEELLYDSGFPLNPNFMGYKVFMASDMPEIDVVLVEDSDPDGGPFGAKGVGTPVMPAVAPAVANAIADAVGERFFELPITPYKIMNVLVNKR
ncbi:MAG: xanthine dehydrogenase family protein molybdopterin-binding subunit [Acidimicrobiales bacterium]|nr:xanthine dehydrogenase family protein molybdopterin-binding subunit [Acidimicrobiales bacterium]